MPNFGEMRSGVYVGMCLMHPRRNAVRVSVVCPGLNTVLIGALARKTRRARCSDYANAQSSFQKRQSVLSGLNMGGSRDLGIVHASSHPVLIDDNRNTVLEATPTLPGLRRAFGVPLWIGNEREQQPILAFEGSRVTLSTYGDNLGIKVREVFSSIIE